MIWIGVDRSNFKEVSAMAEVETDRNVTIPELAVIGKFKESYLYEKSRKDELSGMFRLGKFVRINLRKFHEETHLA